MEEEEGKEDKEEEEKEGPAPAVPPAADAVVRERRLVEAALLPREALGQALSETPPRAPLPAPRRSPENVPELFVEGYADYVREERRQGLSDRAGDGTAEPAASSSSSSAPPLGAAATTPKAPRLRVFPWHRGALHKMLCRAVLVHFMQALRTELGIGVMDPPLFNWEAKRAQEHTAAGEVSALVKYLVETELHIRHGAERSGLAPRAALTAFQAQAVTEERRALARRWRVGWRVLKEDAMVRDFLDGRLTSWPSVRGLLNAAPPQVSSPSRVTDVKRQE